MNKHVFTKRNILICAASGISIRNILSNQNIKFLEKLSKIFKIILVTEPKYIRNDSRLNFLSFKDINEFKINKFDKFFLNILSILFYSHFKTKSHYYMLKEPIFSSKYTILKLFFYNNLPNLKLFSPFINKLYLNFNKVFYKNIISLLREVNPSFIISLNVLNPTESKLLSLAKPGIKTVGIIKSFDNITSNGFMPFIPEKLLVWNDFMKYYAKKAYGLKDNKIFSVGASQYDFLYGSNLDLKKIKNSRNILYCTNASAIYPGDRENVEFLLQKAEKYNFNILLRFHQCDSENRWRGLKKHDRLFLSNYKNFVIGNSEIRVSQKEHLDSLNNDILSSSVVISSYSTIVYDSLARNRPVINLGFDPPETKRNFEVTRFENFEHIQQILENNFVLNAKSQKQLLENIINILDNYSEFINKNKDSKKYFLEKYLSANLKNRYLKNVVRALKE